MSETNAKRKLLPVGLLGILDNNVITVRKQVNAMFNSLKKRAEAVGLKYDIPDTSAQQAALAAAMTVGPDREYIALIAEVLDVSVTSIRKYLKLISTPGKQVIADLVKASGRHGIYHIEVDIAFVEWVRDETVPLNQKNAGGLVDKYEKLLKEFHSGKTDDDFNDDGVRQHIRRIFKSINWTMVMPATVEMKRCAVLKKMKKWFEDPILKDVITGVDPDLLVNADETQINVDPHSRKKVAWPKNVKNKAIVPIGERSSSHLTLFVAVSAGGEVMRPSALLYGKLRKNYNPLPALERRIKCYPTENGYMTQKTFFVIMKEIFVKFVNATRSYYDLEGKRAVLVVDGHNSRFTIATVDLLIENNIHCIILPSHSSHLTQPLDLGLFRILKMNFRWSVLRVKPDFPKKDKKKKGRPPKRKTKIDYFEELMKTQNADLLRGVCERSVETQKRVRFSRYQRGKIVTAVVESLCVLTPQKIKQAFKATHLYPFFGCPNYSKKQEDQLLQQLPKDYREKLLLKASAEEISNTEEPKETEETDTTGVTHVTEGDKETPCSEGQKKARKRTSESSHVIGRPKKRYRKSKEEETETEKDTETEGIEKMKTNKRRGIKYWTGVLTTPAGRNWVEHFEKHPEQFTVSPGTVSANTQQGSLVIVDRIPESEREVADPEDYFTVCNGVRDTP